jgi:hypothetical protein
MKVSGQLQAPADVSAVRRLGGHQSRSGRVVMDTNPDPTENRIQVVQCVHSHSFNEFFPVPLIVRDSSVSLR